MTITKSKEMIIDEKQHESEPTTNRKPDAPLSKATNDEVIDSLFQAIRDGNVGGVQNLINSETVNALDKNYNAPIHVAAMNNQTKIVDLLIKNGANVNEEDLNAQSPLHIAVEKGYERIVDLLRENGADPNIEDYDRKSPLDLAREKGNEQIINLLLPNMIS